MEDPRPLLGKLKVGEEWPGELEVSSPSSLLECAKVSVTLGVVALASVLILLLAFNAIWIQDQGTIGQILTWAMNIIAGAVGWALRGVFAQPP